MTWYEQAAVFSIALGAVVYVLERVLFAIAVVRDIKREQFGLRSELKATWAEIVKCRDSHALAQEQLKDMKKLLIDHRDELDRLFEHTGARREINRY